LDAQLSERHTPGTLWKETQRHWHCYADELNVGERVEYNRPEQTVAKTPDEVMAWMEAETDKLLPRVTDRWRAEADRLRSNETLREIHLAALRGGKGTAAVIRLSDARVMCLQAVQAGPPINHPGILGSQECVRHPS